MVNEMFRYEYSRKLIKCGKIFFDKTFVIYAITDEHAKQKARTQFPTGILTQQLKEKL